MGATYGLKHKHFQIASQSRSQLYAVSWDKPKMMLFRRLKKKKKGKDVSGKVSNRKVLVVIVITNRIGEKAFKEFIILDTTIHNGDVWLSMDRSSEQPTS